MSSTSYSCDSICVLLDSCIMVHSPISGVDSWYFFKCSMLKTGNPGYLSVIRSLNTLGLIICDTSNRPIHLCFSFAPVPLELTQSRVCGLTNTLSPCLNSGTGFLPLLYCHDCSSCALAINCLALSWCIAKDSKKPFTAGFKLYEYPFDSCVSVGRRKLSGVLGW